MSKSTTKKVKLQTRQSNFNYHISKLQAPYKKDIALLIQRLLAKGETIEEIAELLSSNMPITKQRVHAIAKEA